MYSGPITSSQYLTYPTLPFDLNMRKEEVGLIEREGVGLVEIEKPVVEKEMEKRAGLSVEVRPSVKTNISGLLGPRGLRKKSGNDYGGLSAPNYSFDYQKVEGWAVAEKNTKQEGYGFFPKDFKPPSYAAKKPLRFVGQDYMTVTLDCFDCYNFPEGGTEAVHLQPLF